MDNTTKKWLDGINDLKSDGFILQEKDYIDDEFIKNIVEELKKKGVKLNTDEEKRKAATLLMQKMISLSKRGEG